MNLSTRIINPITVIALFAGLSEASATTVLPYLDGDTRQAYIWFLIIFPSALVILFFLTLNFNPKALYVPPEFHTPENSYQADGNSIHPTQDQNLDSRLNSTSPPETVTLQKSYKRVGSHD
jgi:hypothetical protein